MTDQALLPCPFCGASMHFIPTVQPKGWLVDGLHRVWCPFTPLAYDYCNTYVSKDAAREAWNRRAS